MGGAISLDAGTAARLQPAGGRQPDAVPAAAPTNGTQTSDLSRVTLAVANMNCGACMSKIERLLAATPGVRHARVNLSAKRVNASIDPATVNAEGLVEALAGAGFEAAELRDANDELRRSSDHDLLRRLAVAGFAAANVMLLSVSVWAGEASDMDTPLRALFHFISALIALPAVAYAGQPFFRSAVTALRARHLNMDVPISLALILACAMSTYQTFVGSGHVYFDASVSLTFFLLIGRYLDHSLRSRAQGAAANLLGLRSTWATRVLDDGTTQRCAAGDLVPGMRVRVAAGERIPVDGRIVTGCSDLDEQLITGETQPRTARAGEAVYAGTIALTAAIDVDVTAASDDTLLSEIARLMEVAEQNRGRYVRLADRAASLYAPVVHALGLVTFLAWMLAGAGWETALMIAISVLIITCPCALALAVPAVQVAAVSRLFGKGVIVTAADGLERLAEIDTVVFDKTGTLTRGEPVVTNAVEIPDHVLAAAASLATHSRHPAARAVVRAAHARGLDRMTLEGVVEEKSGAGLRHCDSHGEMRLGSAIWCGVDNDSDALPRSDSGSSSSLLYFKADDAAPPVVFQLSDTLRDDAPDVVAELRRSGLDVVLLSGDRAAPVAAVAAACGIRTFFSAHRPDEKIAVLERLKGAGRRVVMIGDGLNDAPALASAHASLSPATAIDVSQMASDGIFQGQMLRPVVDTIAVARTARRMCWQNFGLAAAYNAICIPLAMAGLVTPLIAAVAMSASSILVTGNALRLRASRETRLS